MNGTKILVADNHEDGMYKCRGDLLQKLVGLGEVIISLPKGKYTERLKEIGLDIPQVLELAIKLREKGFNIREDILTIEEAKDEILKAIKGGQQC